MGLRDERRSRQAGVARRGSAAGHDQRALQDLMVRQVMPGMRGLAQERQRREADRATWLRTTETLTEQDRHRTQGVGRALPRPSTLLSHDTLRSIADGCLLNSSIHARRLAGIRSLWTRWSGQRHRPGLAIVHKDHNDPRVDTSELPDLDKRIARVEEIIFRPNKQWAPSLQRAMSPWVEDHLTLDRGVLNVTWDEGGRNVAGFNHVDGATIWPSLLWVDRYIRLNGIRGRHRTEVYDRAYEQAYAEFGGVDLSTVAYVQVDETDPAGLTFLADKDVIVSIAHPSPRMEHFGYGRSPCERSWVASTLYLFGIGYAADFFQNALANKLGLVRGMEPEDVVTLVESLRQRHAGPGQQHAIPFIPLPDDEHASIDFVATREASASDMEYSQTIHHVAMLAAAHYPIDPGDINLTERGPGQSTMSEGNREDERRAQRDEGLLNMGHFCCEDALTRLVQMIDPELKAVWAGIDDEDESRELEMRVKEAQAYRSINEARQAAGDEPIDEKWAGYPQWAAQMVLQQQLQDQAQERQMQMQQQMQQQGMGQEQGGDPQQMGMDPSDAEESEQPPGEDEQQQGQPEQQQGQPEQQPQGAHPAFAMQGPEGAKAAAYIEVYLEDA